MFPKYYNKHIPTTRIFHWITLMSNGLKLDGLGIKSMDDCGFGDNIMFQT
jgi:hypothetical protein